MKCGGEERELMVFKTIMTHQARVSLIYEPWFGSTF